MPISTHSQALFLSLKLLLLSVFIYLYGALLALAIILALSLAFQLVLRILGYRPLVGAELMFYSDRKRPTNVIGVLHIQGNDVAGVISRIQSVPFLPANVHMRCRIISILGESYWSPPMEDFSPGSHIRVLHRDFNSAQDIADFAAQIITQPFPAEKPMWEAVVVDGYKQHRELVLLFKIQHSLADGLSATNCIIGNMVDDYPGLVHRLQTIPWQKKLVTALALPFYSVFVLLRHILAPKDRNLLTHLEYMGTTEIAASRTIKLQTLKDGASRNKVTINDLVTSAMLVAVDKCLIARGDVPGTSGRIRIGMPMMMKEKSRTTGGDDTVLKDMKLDPELTILYTELPLPVHNGSIADEGGVTTIPSSLMASVQDVMSRLKTSIEPLLAYYISTYLVILVPSVLVSSVSLYLADKISLIFSNMATCPKHAHILGHKVTKLYCFPPNYSAIPVVITATSYAGKVHVNCTSDKLDKAGQQLIMEAMYEGVNNIKA